MSSAASRSGDAQNAVGLSEERHEDSRSLARSSSAETTSSVGFESPDDEDHELRMRYFPDADIMDSAEGVGVYDDPTSKSDCGEAPTTGEHENSDNDGQIGDESADEFLNTDATCIPTDSTYIDDSTDEGVHVDNRYSSTENVPDSTVSELSEFEQPPQYGDWSKRAKAATRASESVPQGREGVPEFAEVVTGTDQENSDDDESNNNVVFDYSGTEPASSDEKQSLCVSLKDTCSKFDIATREKKHNMPVNSGHSVNVSPRLQGETVSGDDGDDDATDDEEGYLRTNVGTSGSLVDGESTSVAEHRGANKMERSYDEIVGRSMASLTYKDGHILMDSAGIDTDKCQADTTKNESRERLVNMIDTSIDGDVSEGVSEDTQTDALRDDLEPGTSSICEREELAIGRGYADSIQPRVQDLSHDILESSRYPQPDRDVRTTESRDLLKNRAKTKTVELTRFMTETTRNDGNTLETKKAASTKQQISSDEESKTPDLPLSIQKNSQNVSSSSDSSIGRTFDLCDNESHSSERGSCRRNPNLDDSTFGIDNGMENTDAKSERVCENIKEHVTSSNKHVISEDYYQAIDQDNNPTTVGDGNLTSQDEHKDDLMISADDHVEYCEEHVRGENYHVTESDDLGLGQDDRVTCGSDHMSDRDNHATSEYDRLTRGDEQMENEDGYMSDQDDHVTSGDQEEHTESEVMGELNDAKEGCNNFEAQEESTPWDPDGRGVSEGNFGDEERIEESPSTSCKLSREAESLNQRIMEQDSVSTTNADDASGIIKDAAVDETFANQAEQYVADIISSTQNGMQSSNVSQQCDAYISSTSTEYQQRTLSPITPDIATNIFHFPASTSSSTPTDGVTGSSSVAKRHVDVATRDSVATQSDSVATNIVPIPWDMESGNEAESRSSQVDCPDSAKFAEKAKSFADSSEGGCSTGTEVSLLESTSQIESRADSSEQSFSYNTENANEQYFSDSAESVNQQTLPDSVNYAGHVQPLADSSERGFFHDSGENASEIEPCADSSEQEFSVSMENVHEREPPDSVEFASKVKFTADSSYRDVSCSVGYANPGNLLHSVEYVNKLESRVDSSERGAEESLPDSAENPNEEKNRADSSQEGFFRVADEADEEVLPDSASVDRHASDSTTSIHQGVTSLSRGSSEDSTNVSDEPSTTNANAPASFDRISRNESSTRNGEMRTSESGGKLVSLGVDLVDSSTGSPGRLSDPIRRDHFGSNRDMLGSTPENIVDTTEYLRNRNTTAIASDNIIGTTGYFGVYVDNRASLGTPEDSVGTTPAVTSSGKYDITFEEISSDEELEEGEIAETLGDVSRSDVTPEQIITSSSGSYYPPLDTIPISPPADNSEPSSSFLDFAIYTFPSTQPAGSSPRIVGASMGSPTQCASSSTQLVGSSRVSRSVFPYSALNVRSASNSDCSSPATVGFGSGCNTPIRFQQADSAPIVFQHADSSNSLTPQYEPLSESDDESTGSHDTDEKHRVPDTDSN